MIGENARFWIPVAVLCCIAAYSGQKLVRTHLDETIREPNYDFINYFNILTTPGSFLIDKDHKIIMRSFSLDELQDFFQKTYKNSEE